jgi:cell division protein FtsN
MPSSASSSSGRARGASPRQRGGFAMGLIVGLLVGLALALGVALWVTKVPVPFVDKVPQRTAEQDAAEAERNRNWDPNAPLANRQPRPPVAASTPAGAGSAPATAASAPSARDPAAILAGRPPVGAASAVAPAAVPPPASPPTTSAAPGADPFTYFVQAGAYVRVDEAEQQKARLGMLGLEARITEREQAGRTMYRVRVGPYEKRDQAEGVKAQIDGAGIESVLVRVQKTP